nr:uncharacterized protein LOC116778266 [Danaus plexippus plexippus]
MFIEHDIFLNLLQHLVVVRGVHIEPAHVVKKRSIDQPLRISIFYDHSVYRLEPEKFVVINVSMLATSLNNHLTYKPTVTRLYTTRNLRFLCDISDTVSEK